jgi:hypothetical protein
MQAAVVGPGFWRDSHWIAPGNVAVNTKFSFQAPDRLDIDERGAVSFLQCAPPRNPSVTTLCLRSLRDGKGAELQGDSAYRLHIPPRVPVKHSWAVTVYDLQSAAFIRDSPLIGLNSLDSKLHKNRDGSIDVFFGQYPPAGKKVNWVYTAAGKPWFSAFHFCGPERALLDRAWHLPDLEPITAAQATVALNSETPAIRALSMSPAQSRFPD